MGDHPEGQEEHPVTGISWYEAAAYAAFVGKSLPTIYHWDRVALTWASGDIVPLSNLSGRGLLPVGGTSAMHRYGTHDLAGNAREWCVNESSRGGRFILGGGWNDPAYAFNDVYAQSPWDRSETNGLRCIRSVETTADEARLAGPIELPFRDFLSETPVSDETFERGDGLLSDYPDETANWRDHVVMWGKDLRDLPASLLRAAGHPPGAQEDRPGRDRTCVPDHRARPGVADVAGRVPRTRRRARDAGPTGRSFTLIVDYPSWSSDASKVYFSLTRKVGDLILIESRATSDRDSPDD